MRLERVVLKSCIFPLVETFRRFESSILGFINLSVGEFFTKFV